MFDVFCWRLCKMKPKNGRRKKLGDKVEDMENELACDSND